MVFMSSSKPGSTSPSNSSPSSPPPEKDPDSASPRKASVFQRGCQRFCSSLVLFSFLFQTLWPSVAFSMDDPAGALDSPLPASRRSVFKGGPFDESLRDESLRGDPLDLKDRKPVIRALSLPLNPLAEGLNDVPTLILPSFDTQGEDFDKKQPALLAAFQFKDLKDDAVFKMFRKEHSLYQNLVRIQNEQDEVDALLWLAHGIKCALFANGDLSVIGDPSRPSPSVLGITNPNGHLHLCENLRLNHLLVKASSVSHTGLNTDIKQLDVWATGKGDSEKKGGGLFINKLDSNLTSRTLTVHEGRFQNQGQLSGLRKLHVQSGLNQGSILSQKLTLMIDELFTNEKRGGLVIQTLFKTRGAGAFQQNGILKAASLLIDNAFFSDQSGLDRFFESVEIGPNVQRWFHGNDSTWTIQSLDLYGESVLNEGTLKTDDLTNHAASLQNKGSVQTKRLSQYGKTLLNEEEGFLDVTEEAQLGADRKPLTLINKGEFNLKGKSSGTITRLQNYGGFSLEGEHRFKGGILANYKNFIVLKSASSLFEWQGDLFINHKKMTLSNALIAFNNTFINHQTLITELPCSLKGDHFENQGTIEAKDAFSFEGNHFKDSKTSKLTAKGFLTLQTQNPLSLKGTTEVHQGARLWSPDTVNEGTFIGHPDEESTLIQIQGRLTNLGPFTAEDIGFTGPLEERVLFNDGGEMTLERILSPMGLVKTQFTAEERSKPLKERASHLTVQSGPFKTVWLDNKGRFTHTKGLSALASLLNEEGSAFFDELSFYEDAATGIGENQALAGILRAKHYRHHSGSAPLEALAILGSIFFETGNLQAKSLLIGETGQLWLGEGVHQLDSIQNRGLLVPEEGADIRTESLDNARGIIESESSLRVIALSPEEKPQTTKGKTPTITLTKGFIKDTSQPAGRGRAANLNPGHLKAKDDLILELARSVDVFECLDRFNNKWKQGRTLFIYGNKFLQTKDLTRSGHLFLTLIDFENLKSKLTANTFDLVTINPPIIGSSNEEIGRIWTIPSDKKNVFGNNHLSILLKKENKGSLNFLYTGLFGHGPLSLTAEGGDVVYGTVPISGQLSTHNPTQHCKGGCGDHHYLHTYHYKGNASLASNSHIQVTAGPSKSITFGFTTVKGMSTAHFFVPSGVITNLSSAMSFRGTVTLEGNTYHHDRYDVLRLFACPDQNPFLRNGFKTTFKDFNVSDRAELISKTGSLLYKVQNLRNNASDMLAAGNILHNKTNLLHSSSFTNTKRSLSTYSYDEQYAGGASLEQNYNEYWGRHLITIEEAGRIISGHTFSSNGDEQIHNGYLSAGGEVILTGRNLRMEAFAHFLRDIAQYKNGRDVVKAFVDHALQNNPLLDVNDRGDIVNAVPFTDPWLKYFNENRQYMPMLDNPGEHDDVRHLPLAAPLDVQLEAFFKSQFFLTSKAYRKQEMKTLFGDAMLIHSLLAGRHEAEMGNLTEARLGEIVRLIGYFKPTPNKKGKPSLMLQIHLPDHEIDQEHGNAATMKSRLSIKSLMDEDTILTGARHRSYEGGIDLSTGQDLDMEASKAHAKESIFLNAGRDTNLRSTVHRQGYEWDYQDTVNFNELRSDEKKIVSTSGRDLNRTGDQTTSKEGTIFTARRNILTETLVLERQKISHGPGKTKKENWANHVSVSDKTDGLLYYISGGDQHHVALNAEAREMLFQGKSVNFLAVHDTYVVEERSTETKRGFLSEKTIHKYSQVFEALSKGPTLKASKAIELIAEEGDITVTDISVDALEFILKAVNGKVTFKVGIDYHSSFRTEQSYDMWWQRMTQEVQEHQTYSQNKINASVQVTSKETLIELIREETTAWIKGLQQTGGEVTYLSKEEIHKIEKIDHEGPTAQLTAVIALAAGIAATASGAGAALAKSIIGTLELSAAGTAAAAISAMSPAFIASLSSQAAIALASNRFDIGKAAESLAKGKVLKSMMISTVAAGFTGGLGHQFGIPTTALDCTTPLHHAQRFALQAGIEMGMSVLTGEDFGDAALGALRNGVANTVGGILSNKIGAENLDFLTHKMLHAAAGAMGGMIANGNLLAGATGAVAAELMTCVCESPEAAGERAVQKAILEGKPLDKATLTPMIREELQKTINMARLGAAVAALITKQDVNEGIRAGTIAVENNFFPGADKVAMRAAVIAIATLSTPQLIALGLTTLGITAALIAKQQIEQALNTSNHNPFADCMDAAPQDVEWTDQGLEAEDGKPTVHVTPENDYRSTDQGFEEAPIDLTRGTNEGYQQHDGPDTSVLEKEQVKPYEVGGYREMIDRSKGDKMEIHHAPQQHPANQAIDKYNHKNGPSIALPVREHKKIPNIKGEYEGTARDLMANDAQNLRKYTQAPNEAIEELIGLTKLMYPKDFAK